MSCRRRPLAVDARPTVLLLAVAALTACSGGATSPPPSPSPTSSQSAVVAAFCGQVDALSDQVAQLQASPAPRLAREVADAASRLTEQSGDVAEAVVSEPALTEQLNACTSELQAISAAN